MKDGQKGDTEEGYLVARIVEWRQRVYIFPFEVFTPELILYKKGMRLEDLQVHKNLRDLAGEIVKLPGVIGVVFLGCGMTVFKDNEQVWEVIEDGLKGVLDKFEYPRPVRPKGAMQEGWKVICSPHLGKENTVSFTIDGRKLMYQLDGRRFTRAEWGQAVADNRLSLENEMQPRGFVLTALLFATTDATSIVMMSGGMQLEFAMALQETDKRELKNLVERFVRDVA
jgi:hypothetical protein